ncbi:MAG: hypothetical protein ACOYL4_03550 [Miltoncostaeaceae bacterium]
MRIAPRLLVVILAALALVLAGGAGAATAAAPIPVHTGIYVTNVQDVDLDANSFVTDFFVWFRWKGPRSLDPAASIELMNQSEAWGTIVTPSASTPKRLRDGSWYSLARYQSRFNTDFQLQAYPFSTQQLVVMMESGQQDAENLVFVADRSAVAVAPDVELSGYSVGTPTFTVADVPYTTTFGNTDLARAVPYSRITVSIPITRPVVPYALKIFLPMLIVVVCAALVFLINPTHVDSRFAMGLTALLTIIAIKWVTDGEIPNVNYFTLVDALFLPALALSLLGLSTAVWSSRMVARGEPVKDIVRSDQRLMMVGIGGYVAATIIIFWMFLA